MKIRLFATALLFAAAQAGAGFVDHNENRAASEPPYGKVFTAREVQNLPDDTNVVLEGQIVGRAPNGKRDEYIFRDSRRWRGRTVTPKNTVRLWGEVDYKRSANRVEIDVDHYYSGDPEQIGKNVGDDLAEGKPTLPLIYLMNQGSGEAAADVRAALKNADRSYFDKIHAHVAASDALPYCIGQAQEAVDKAVACLDVLPDNEAVRAMRDLAAESVARWS